MSASQVRTDVAERRESARRLVREGLTAREVSVRLGVSMRTVERYLNRVRAERGPASTTPYARRG